MANVKHPEHVTWDDVRLSRRPKKKRRNVTLVAGALGVIVVAVSVFRLRQDEVRPEPRLVFRSAPPRERSLCEVLHEWSATTALILGPQTRRACPKAEKPAVSQTP